MKIFARVIGASVGVVVVVFVIVAGILYWSGPKSAPAARDASQDPARADSTTIARSGSSGSSSERPRSNSEVKQKRRRKRSRPTPVVQKRSAGTKSPALIAATKRRAGRSSGKPGGGSKTMSPEEYIEREVYYIEKIRRDSEEVLQRAAQERAKQQALQAELDALLYPK